MISISCIFFIILILPSPISTELNECRRGSGRLSQQSHNGSIVPNLNYALPKFTPLIWHPNCQIKLQCGLQCSTASKSPFAGFSSARHSIVKEKCLFPVTCHYHQAKFLRRGCFFDIQCPFQKGLTLHSEHHLDHQLSKQIVWGCQKIPLPHKQNHSLQACFSHLHLRLLHLLFLVIATSRAAGPQSVSQKEFTASGTKCALPSCIQLSHFGPRYHTMCPWHDHNWREHLFACESPLFVVFLLLLLIHVQEVCDITTIPFSRLWSTQFPIEPNKPQWWLSAIPTESALTNTIQSSPQTHHIIPPSQMKSTQYGKQP